MDSERRNMQQRFAAWVRRYHTPNMVRRARRVPLRQDMMTLMTYVRDHKVVGTQSTGNMPLKHIREVTSHFVEPPVLDTTIGDRTYRLRTEFDVWPLHYLHILADVGQLLDIAPARRWRITKHGKRFMDTDPLLQLSNLLTIWWYYVNWLVAYPLSGMGEMLPPDFNLITLDRLRSLPLGPFVSFEAFADGLIEEAELTWAAEDPSIATMTLRSSIARMVIYILANFGALTYKTREEPLGKGTIEKLDRFKITSLGRCLLDNLDAVRSI